MRTKYFSAIWYTYPSMDKFVQLCNSKNVNTTLNIARFILIAFKVRLNVLTNK